MFCLQAFQAIGMSLYAQRKNIEGTDCINFTSDVIVKHYPSLIEKKTFLSGKIRRLVSKNVLNCPLKGYYCAGLKYSYVVGIDFYTKAVTAEKPLASIEDKKDNFKKAIFQYVRSEKNNTGLKEKDKSDVKTLKDFFDYWGESDGKKLRWEKQDAFEIGKRLKRWTKNNNGGSNGEEIDYRPGLR